LETEQEVKTADVPQNVMNALKEKYADYEIEESEISETASGTVYEFEMEKGESKLEVAIDKTGKIVKSEKMTEEDND
ncbi:MAG: hypothetical protein V7767_13360, partial [Leeuwenhoekiella sp.]